MVGRPQINLPQENATNTKTDNAKDGRRRRSFVVCTTQSFSLRSLRSFVAENVFFDLKLVAAEIDQQSVLDPRRLEIAQELRGADKGVKNRCLGIPCTDGLGAGRPTLSRTACSRDPLQVHDARLSGFLTAKTRKHERAKP